MSPRNPNRVFRDTDRREPALHEPSRPVGTPPDGSGRERPLEGPAGRRTPYPADAPPLDDLPGSEPDYEPGRPLENPTPRI